VDLSTAGPGYHPLADFEAGSFQLVAMRHSLEHVHDPLRLLRDAHRILMPGGKLVVAVPNIDSLPFRWFGHSWYGLDLPRHLTHFAPWTLHLMLERAGFLVGRVRMLPDVRTVRRSAKLASTNVELTSDKGEAATLSSGLPWTRRLMNGLRARPLARLASWYCLLTHQCDCMLVVARR
jgi:SAM-dependent methyltransferase